MLISNECSACFSLELKISSTNYFNLFICFRFAGRLKNRISTGLTILFDYNSPVNSLNTQQFSIHLCV